MHRECLSSISIYFVCFVYVIHTKKIEEIFMYTACIQLQQICVGACRIKVVVCQVFSLCFFFV